MGRTRPVQRNKEILTKYSKGSSVSDLAAEYGVTVQTIKNVIYTSTATYWEKNDKTANAILRAHADGLSDSDICSEVGVTEDILMAFYMYYKPAPVKPKVTDLPKDKIYRSLVKHLNALGIFTMAGVLENKDVLDRSLDYCEKNLLQSMLKVKGGST